jgi:2-oxoglutarate dehydrogenase E2 component (dihydrolipoamide succinyltransferase)
MANIKEVKVPALGESVSEATIASWNKQAGEAVEIDELLVELETDKVTLEVNAPVSGKLTEIKIAEGETVEVGTLIALIEEGAAGDAPKAVEEKKENSAVPAAAPANAAANQHLSPAPRKIIADNGLNAANISGSGKDGRVTKGDALNALNNPAGDVAPLASGEKPVERVKMSRLRQRIAERLKESQNTAAILTTFNEIDMTEVLAFRNAYKDKFLEQHGVKLGFMSFFVKACIAALKEVPSVNAEIDGTDLIYKNFYDIAVAVGTPQGLVVPVVRNADQLSFAGVEQEILNLAGKAKDGKLSMEDLTGGTFTVSNGGVYGSLLSTPIINPPQSGILGMHKTQERAMVIDGKIEIRPMMYIALSYDHRIIDGKEAVTFLVKVKEAIEDPKRLLLGV